ncbi:DUF3617 domain-containing protein [Sphingomonas sp. DT-204]|uniref:DUF3617 domain-containing protein n=1 Tax=Sphingomonas sp. DT-204 TaxID=3396166 RepID=UPI003F1A20F7
MVRNLVRTGLAGGLLMCGLAGMAAPAQAPGFAALKGLEHGQWQLREASGVSRSVCLRDPASLFQQRHRGAECSRLVIENGPNRATVSYTCPGTGRGRTTITVETPRLVRIQSQGLEEGAPFDLDIEGRKVGACPIGN